MPKMVMFDGWHLFGGANWQHATINDWRSCKNQPAVDGMLTSKRRNVRSPPSIISHRYATKGSTGTYSTSATSTSKYLYSPRMMDKNATSEACNWRIGPPILLLLCVCVKEAGCLFHQETFLIDGPYLLAGKFMHK